MKKDEQILQMKVDAIDEIIDWVEVSELRETLQDVLFYRLTHEDDIGLADRRKLIEVYHTLSRFFKKADDVQFETKKMREAS